MRKEKKAKPLTNLHKAILKVLLKEPTNLKDYLFIQSLVRALLSTVLSHSICFHLTPLKAAANSSMQLITVVGIVGLGRTGYRIA